MAQSRLQLFPERTENLLLALPFLFIPLVIWEYASGVNWSADTWNMARFLVATIGLGGTHSLLSYSMLYGLPEFKNWKEEQIKKHPLLFYFRLYGSILSLALLTFVMFGFLQTNPVWIHLVIIGFTLLSVHHAALQCMGLSQAYTAQMLELPDLNESERAKLLDLQRREVKIKNIWEILMVTYTTILFLPEMGFAKIPILGDVAPLIWISRGLVLSALALFLFNCHKISRIRKTNKFLFSWRIFMFAAVPGSGSIALVYMSRLIHAFEYWGVYQLFTQNSKANEKTKSRLGWVTFTMLIIGTGLVFFRKEDGFFNELIHISPNSTHLIIAFLASISIMQTNIHFYIDSLLFRMRDPLNRKWIQPLLLGKPQPNKIAQPQKKVDAA